MSAKTLVVYPEWLFDGSPIPILSDTASVPWNGFAGTSIRRTRHPATRSSLPNGRTYYSCHFRPRNPDGTRIIKKVVIQLGRGSRKTALAAAIVLLCLFGPEAMPGSLIQSAAFARKQARELFEEVSLIVSQTPVTKRLRAFATTKARFKTPRSGRAMKPFRPKGLDSTVLLRP